MSKILALWGVPRGTTTAFTWMMSARGDFDCYHEPFGRAYYQGENPLSPDYQTGDKKINGLSLESSFRRIEAGSNKANCIY